MIQTIDYLPPELFDFIQTSYYLPPEVFDLIHTIDYLYPEVFDLIQTIDYLPPHVFDLIQTINYLPSEVFDLIQTINYLPPEVFDLILIFIASLIRKWITNIFLKYPNVTKLGTCSHYVSNPGHILSCHGPFFTGITSGNLSPTHFIWERNIWSLIFVLFFSIYSFIQTALTY